MVREVLPVAVGYCGIQMDATVWEQYYAEHGITQQGDTLDKYDGSFRCFFDNR